MSHTNCIKFWKYDNESKNRVTYPLIPAEHTHTRVTKRVQNTLQVLLLICSIYLATLSRASVSGGGTIKHAPGRVLTTPSRVWSCQFWLSRLDFSVILSPRLTISWDRKRDGDHVQTTGQRGFESEGGSPSHVSVHPVTQGHRSGGFGGEDAALLQRRDAAAELLQSGQTLLVPLHRRLVSLKVGRRKEHEVKGRPQLSEVCFWIFHFQRKCKSQVFLIF